MEMDSLDIIGILLGAVAGMAHVSDHIPGSDHAAFLQIQRIGEILTQVGVIVVAFTVKASDADPPAAVLVPAESLHVAGFHTYDGCADLPHHVMPKVGTLIAIASGGAKVVIVAVFKTLGNRGKGFEAIDLFPLLTAVIGFLLNFIFPHHSAEHGFVGFIIIFIIFHVLGEFFQSGLALGELIGQLLEQRNTFFVEGTALLRTHVGQQLDPVQTHRAVIAVHIQIVGRAEGFVGDVEIYPLDIFPIGAGSHFNGGFI